MLQLWRMTDERKYEEARQGLLSKAAGSKRIFSETMIQVLPETSRRYFLFSIAPEAPITTVAEEVSLSPATLLPQHAVLWELNVSLAINVGGVIG